MKEIELTKGLKALVDDEDYPFLVNKRWCAHKVRNRFYAQRTEGQRKGQTRRTLMMHREILQAPTGLDIDHIDGNGLNNQKSNLRLCTRQENLRAFQQKVPNCTSCFRGVSAHTQNAGRWRATIKVNRKQIALGCFSSPEEAARAYDAAAKAIFGEFACPNFK